MKRRSFLTSISRAIVIAVSAPVILAEAIRAEPPMAHFQFPEQSIQGIIATMERISRICEHALRFTPEMIAHIEALGEWRQPCL